MIDREKVITALECCKDVHQSGCWASGCISCWYADKHKPDCFLSLADDAAELLNEQEKEIKSLRLLVEWAEECDFGFDQFQDEYERYRDEIEDMGYIDGMIHVAKRTLEARGAFEEGR